MLVGAVLQCVGQCVGCAPITPRAGWRGPPRGQQPALAAAGAWRFQGRLWWGPCGAGRLLDGARRARGGGVRGGPPAPAAVTACLGRRPRAAAAGERWVPRLAAVPIGAWGCPGAGRDRASSGG